MLTTHIKKQLRELSTFHKELGGIIEDDTIKILYIGNDTEIDLEWTGETEILFHTHPHHNDPPSPQDISYMLTSVIGDLAHIVYDSRNGINHSLDTYLSVKKYLVVSLDQIYVYFPRQTLIEDLIEDISHLDHDGFSENVDMMIKQIRDYCSDYLPSETFTEFKNKLSRIGVEINVI